MAKTSSNGNGKTVAVPAALKPKIISAKILKGPSVEVEFTIGEGQEETGSHSYKHEPHKHLTDAFRSLKVHLALFLQLATDKVHCNIGGTKDLKIPDFKEQEMEDQFRVYGFRIVSKKSGNYVILGGGRELVNGQVFNFVTPPIHLTPEQGSDGAYKYVDDLNDKLETAVIEVIGYMNGKKGVEQSAMDFSQGETE